jgi:ribosomal protein L12E/L44/L45/RPP1/RPP2
MKYLAAYGLLILSGKKDIKTEDLLAFLESIGSPGSPTLADEFMSSITEKDLFQFLEVAGFSINDNPVLEDEPEKIEEMTENENVKEGEEENGNGGDENLENDGGNNGQ